MKIEDFEEVVTTLNKLSAKVLELEHEKKIRALPLNSLVDIYNEHGKFVRQGWIIKFLKHKVEVGTFIEFEWGNGETSSRRVIMKVPYARLKDSDTNESWPD